MGRNNKNEEEDDDAKKRKRRNGKNEEEDDDAKKRKKRNDKNEQEDDDAKKRKKRNRNKSDGGDNQQLEPGTEKAALDPTDAALMSILATKEGDSELHEALSDGSDEILGVRKLRGKGHSEGDDISMILSMLSATIEDDRRQ